MKVPVTGENFMISILYVDDEETLLHLCKLFLERKGEFTVDTCISAIEALELIKAGSFDAIISDYQMPEMDGIEFLIQVRSIYGDIPFILFTGRGREEVVVRAIDNGVDFYLQKGGDPKSQFAELSHKVRKSVERNQAVRTLATNEERMRLALDGANEGLWDINIATGASHLSPRGCELLGYSPEEMLKYNGKGWRDLVHPDDIPITKAILNAYYEGRSEFFQVEQRLRMKSGEWKWVLSRGRVVERDKEENPIRFVGTHTDITEQKKAEAALTLAKKDWETIFRANGNPTFILDSDHRIIEANEAVLTLIGKTLDEVKGLQCWSIFHDGESVPYPETCPLEKMRSSGVMESLVLEIKALNRVFITSCTPIFDENNNLLKSIHIATDITEIKLLEEALRENRDYLSQIFSTVKEGIVIIDAHTHEVIDINPAAIQMIGSEKAEILHRICHTIICPDECNMCPITDLHQTEDNSGRVLLTSDGRRIPIIKYVVPFNFQGRDCLLETFIDISDRKNAEEKLLASYEQISGAEEELRSQFKELSDLKNALQASETKYRAIVETSPDVIWDIDLDGTLTYISPRSLDILGYTPEELIGSSILSLIASESVEVIKDALLSSSLRKPGLISFNITILHRDGSRLSINARSYPLINETGSHVGFRGVGRDVTELIMAERALRESEARFDEVAQNAGIWIWEVDEVGIYQYCNPAVFSILGYSPDELVGKKHFWELFTSDVREELFDVAMRAFDMKMPFHNFIHTNLHKNGNMVILETSGSPSFDVDGVFRGYRGTDTDITERKNAEITLRRINRHLSLLSSISRLDMLNTISSLNGYIASAEEKTDDPDMRMELDKMKSAVLDVQSHIVFTQVYQDIGAFESRWQELNVALPRTGIPDSITYTRNIEDILIYADPMIDKVFLNLLDNSIFHGKTVSEIIVSTRETSAGFFIIWEDNGIGISANEKEEIFERGFGKNIGLGLFLVREILALTGITIREVGEEGKGAKFEITVPKESYRNRPQSWGRTVWSCEEKKNTSGND
ncbi:MAG: hypothetical protein CVV33_03450 [Methanomicrobiales archaeon HGW-Methanomicrobiales-4]|nr:MAG: hypothetical protein CVV33_03450 [Methanomicrobiales archaeon HGW-Methanomicrobiales-4]